MKACNLCGHTGSISQEGFYEEYDNIICFQCGAKSGCCVKCLVQNPFADGDFCHVCKHRLPSTVEERREWMRMSAEDDEKVWAKYALAKSLMESNCTVDAENVNTFLTLILKCCENDYVPALMSAGDYYFRMLEKESPKDMEIPGNTVTENSLYSNYQNTFIKARCFYSRARDLGQPFAVTCLGRLYDIFINGKNEALNYFETAASNGCIDAAYSAAMEYRSRWVEMSKAKESLTWINSSKADIDTAVSFISRAVELFSKGAEIGRSDSQLGLAVTLIEEAKTKYIDDEVRHICILL